MIPDLQIPALRDAYNRRDPAPFEAVGAKLGIDLRLVTLARALQVVAERDLYVVIGEMLRQIYTALASDHGYGFAHIAQPGCRPYTVLAVRDGWRLIASVQTSTMGNPLPNPGWSLPRWMDGNTDRNEKLAQTWAREPARVRDAGELPIVKPLPWSKGELARDDVRRIIGSLQRHLAAMPLRNPERKELRGRLNEMIDAHRTLIAGELHAIAESYVIRDGIVDSVTIRASELARNIDTFAQRVPRRVCIVVDREPSWQKIVDSGVLPRARDLEVTGWNARPSYKPVVVDFGTLAKVRFDSLERLKISFLAPADDAWRMLDKLYAPSLRAFHSVSSGIDLGALEQLADPTRFPRLDDIGVLEGGSERAKELERAIGTRPGLRAIDLACDSDTAVYILDHAESLTSFALRSSEASDAVLEALERAMNKRSFERVQLDSHSFTVPGVDRWIRSAGFANLDYLLLRTRWSQGLLAPALLATNGRTRIEDVGFREITPEMRRHVDFVRTHEDGSIDLAE